MTIDVGISGDMDNFSGDGYTFVTKGNPANATGIITACLIWAASACENVEIAAFTAVGNDLTTRGYASLPNLASGNNSFLAVDSDFTPFEIRTGDYIGIYFTDGLHVGVDLNRGDGVGLWRKAGDHIPAVGETFTLTATEDMSIYAEGFQLGQISIGEAWKDIQNIQINIGDAWKQITLGSKINISDVWKEILH